MHTPKHGSWFNIAECELSVLTRQCLGGRTTEMSEIDRQTKAWASGRTTFSQDGKVRESYGRDHHAGCFTMLAAGSGFKPGLIHGQTDEFCYSATEGEVPVHDLHATILHQLGIDHERLTFKHQGRHYRLTDVHGHVVKDILI